MTQFPWNMKNKMTQDSVNKYIINTKGMMTKQLAGQSYGTSCLTKFSKGGTCKHYKPKLQIALDRLPYFSFIGITDYYDLSLCLFSKMFNVKLNKQSFEVVRKTKVSSINKHRIQKLFQSFHDEYDDQIYKVALEIFKKNIKTYNITAQSCMDIKRSILS